MGRFRRRRIFRGEPDFVWREYGVLVWRLARTPGPGDGAWPADQGRDVYAVPGNVTSKNSWTPNTLIKQGAQLTVTWEDVWETLPRRCGGLELEWAVNRNRVAASLLAEQVGDRR